MSIQFYMLDNNTLSNYVFQLLQEKGHDVYTTLPHEMESDSVVLAIYDSVSTNQLLEWNQKFHQTKGTFIPIQINFGETMIGPVVNSNESGCLMCVNNRWLTSRGHEENYKLFDEKFDGRKDYWLSDLNLHMLGQIILSYVEKFTKGRWNQHSIYSFNLLTLQGKQHYFIPDPQCDVCSPIKDDDSEDARVTFISKPKKKRTDDRIESVEKWRSVLHERFLDQKVGLMQSLNHMLIYEYSVAVGAEMKIPNKNYSEHGIGRGIKYADGRVIAMLEALERYAGYRPQGKRTKVFGSYQQLKDDALDPVSLGLHFEEDLKRNHDLVSYSDDVETEWVWGYSFKQKKPILVPEHIAYYFVQFWKKNIRFFYEVSNGCALGSCAEETILHGIFEVIERDAFLMTWYCKLSPVEIDLESVERKSLRLLIKRMKHAGYRVVAFDIRTELNIPAVWVMTINEKDEGPYILCSAGAHFDFEEAIESALGELSLSASWREREEEEKKSLAYEMLEDSYKATEMHDHALLYTIPEAASRLDFLWKSKKKATVQELQATAETFEHDDLKQDVEALIKRVNDCNLDVIVVEQTPPEMKKVELETFKVIIPGMLPMTFGHHRRRVNGLTRLLTVPAQLGYENAPTSYDELNPCPHPFP